MGLYEIYIQTLMELKCDKVMKNFRTNSCETQKYQTHANSYKTIMGLSCVRMIQTCTQTLMKLKNDKMMKDKLL